MVAATKVLPTLASSAVLRSVTPVLPEKSMFLLAIRTATVGSPLLTASFKASWNCYCSLAEASSLLFE
jgi:hypothetical protein